MRQQPPDIDEYATRASLHAERARKFLAHADVTNSLSTREMYLQLARCEVALAERAKALVGEHRSANVKLSK